jgi:type II secretory pathway predicted ATPase ExeA
MADAITSSPNQSSWFSLGFDAPPFSREQNQTLFFKSQALVNALNKLCTLDTSETCITALVGEKGSGKTTCLKTLNKTRTHYTSTYIQATRGLSPLNLIKCAFPARMQTSPSQSRTASKEDCITLLKKLAAEKRQTRLLIDNAHFLPEKTLSLIQTLAEIQPNGSQLQFVLCSHQPKSIAKLYQNDQVKTQAIQLNNLTRQETERFLYLQMQQSSSQKNAHIIPRDYLDQLHDSTQGNITRIQKIAEDSLPNVLKAKQNRIDQPKKIWSISPDLAIKAMVLPALLATSTMVGYAIFHTETKTTPPQLSTKATTPKAQIPSPEKISRLLYALSLPD